MPIAQRTKIRKAREAANVAIEHNLLANHAQRTLVAVVRRLGAERVRNGKRRDVNAKIKIN